MLQLRFRKTLSSIRVLSLSCLLLIIIPSIASLAQNDEAVRADLPSNGALRVENSRGNVSLEVWNEQYVSVSTIVEGTQPRRSPVVIQRTDQQLSVSITRESLGTLARINLVLKVPERSRVEVSTVSGKVEVKGLPAALSVQTVSGDIRAEISPTSDASITAESMSRAVESTLPREGLAPARGRFPERLYQARFGAGTKIVRINTRLGGIVLASLAVPSRNEGSASGVANSATQAQPSTQAPAPQASLTQIAPPQAASRPPELVGAAARTNGVGTPANDTGAP
ncbi:MAG TPA: hypothetical protein VK619_04195, partial [Pyrinomonadaceae bacterium]|nr:hypothetical protein [Pyrinomonadaceae bacterium]